MMAKKRTIYFFSLGLILFGILFAAINGYKYVKGYTSVQSISEETKAKHTKTQKSDLTLYPRIPKIGENIGQLVIPKLHAVLPIYHGTNEEELEKGVGHYAGSVLPGEQDNCVLSGHRDTVFRRLGEVGKGDLLIVKTAAGEFTYKVRKVRIVDADNRTVIVPKPKATLTVSTCYPFNFIGSAPQRYVLVADLIENKK
jgi:sortase A